VKIIFVSAAKMYWIIPAQSE